MPEDLMGLIPTQDEVCEKELEVCLKISEERGFSGQTNILRCFLTYLHKNGLSLKPSSK